MKVTNIIGWMAEILCGDRDRTEEWQRTRMEGRGRKEGEGGRERGRATRSLALELLAALAATHDSLHERKESIPIFMWRNRTDFML